MPARQMAGTLAVLCPQPLLRVLKSAVEICFTFTFTIPLCNVPFQVVIF